MPAVSETLVREYFELHEFLVRQPRKYIAPARREQEDDIDFFVLNPRPVEGKVNLPFVLTSADLPCIARAIVVVKGWHTETFSSGRLANAPEILRFVEPRIFRQAVRFFDTEAVLKLLVVPSLPQETQARDQSLNLLRSRGVDGVLLFRTLLADLIARVEANRNYQKSDLLQMIRILKTYDLFKSPQLELFKPGRRRSEKKTSPAPSGD